MPDQNPLRFSIAGGEAIVSLTTRELDLLLEDLGARVYEMNLHGEELNEEEAEFLDLEWRLREARRMLAYEEE